jgi:hypothetical protein
VLAGMAALALWGAWSLSVVGCAPGSGYGRTDAAAGFSFPNVRPSPGEFSRLERNARYYRLMGRPELGLKELELAHRQNPENLQITNFLARSYEELGKFEAARQLYQEALTRYGPHPVLANNLCFSYYQEGRWQEAETCFCQALIRDPGNVAARNNLGLLYCRLGRPDEARRLWQDAEGAAAADAKMGQALAALGMADRSLYARGSEPAPPAPGVTQARTPIAAVSRLSAPVSGQDNRPAQSVAPKESTGLLATKDVAPAPGPVGAGPTTEARGPTAVPPKALAAGASAPTPRAAPRPHPPPLTAAELMDTAIEIRNGTWTKNLARQTRARLRQQGFTVARIGNHLDFGATRTIIYYRPGADRVARAVGRAVFSGAGLEPSLKLKKGVDIKILLGADFLERPQMMARLLAGEQ